MRDRAQQAGFRAPKASLTVALLAALALAASASPATAASTSVVNGKITTISEWPWQVAITEVQRPGQKRSPRARFFCGGSLITPDLVITAGHCVAPLKPRQARKIEIVSGRTRLNNESQGQTARVASVLMPLDSRGKRRYDGRNGGAKWDVALLQLKTPLPGATIKLAGEDESDSWAPGHPVTTTGWGVTGFNNRKGSAVLRVANQVMLSDQVCRRFNGKRGYDARTMNCLGGPATHSSSCFGDSGGPLVAAVGAEYRLVGLTSFGDPFCSPYLPSVDSRVAGAPMKTWVQQTASRISGVDVVGSGGSVEPDRAWCRIPALGGLRVSRARTKLIDAGCRIGRIVRSSPGGRVIAASFIQGWLAPVGTRIKLWVGP